jgi:hypothetical protein
VADKPVATYEFVVAVRLTGFGDETEAAKVFSSYNGQFVLDSGDVAEIIDVAPLDDDTEIVQHTSDVNLSKAMMKKQAAGGSGG